MKFSYKWLKKLVDFDATPEKLAEDLSLKSIEIENIERFGGEFLDTVVVGEIKEIVQHPNADKLKVTKTDVGSQVLQIVCGAPNIEVGQKVPVALVGTKLPMGEIKEAKIRGTDSFGMLCAEDELVLGSDHSGILILDPTLAIGTKLSDIYNDYILEGNVLPNRGDLQNHVQLAREIAAVYELDFKEQDIFIIDEKNEVSDLIEVEDKDSALSQLYTARMIRDIKIGPSPVWMQQSLLACGMKPINNVVDITNYVMLEYGNPLHAFDATKIKQVNGKHKIVVRLSSKNETIRTLDGKDHELPEGLLVIADSEKPVAVAGVMGGENSEIDDSTLTVILESAAFNQKYIRKSQRELGIATEASMRFAKDLSPYLALQSLDRAAQLFVDLCGGELVSGKVMAGEYRPEKQKISFEFEKIKDYLSIDISKEESIKILQGLGFEMEGDDVVIPLWRKDVSIWQDLSEEVGRIYGLDRASERALDVQITPDTKKNLYFESSAKKFLSSIGLTEIYSLSILSSETAEKVHITDRYFEITNPMNEHDRIMRPSLIPGILSYASQNAKKFDRFAFFDLSKIYLPSDNQDIPANENRMLSLLVYGENKDEGIFILKKYLTDFGEKFGLKFEFENIEYSILNINYMHPGRCAKILYKGEAIGNIFEIHPLISENLDLKHRCWVAELNFEALALDAKEVETKFLEQESDVIYQDFSRFEVSKRDIAVVVDENLDPQEIIKTIKGIDAKITGADLFDEFRSEKFGVGKKSLAFHLVFQANDHTLTDEETNKLFNDLLAILKDKYNLSLRG